MPSSLAFSTDPGLKLTALLICICSSMPVSFCVCVCVHAPRSLRFRELFGLCFLRPANVSFHVVGPRMANAKSTNSSLATPYLPPLHVQFVACVSCGRTAATLPYTHTHRHTPTPSTSCCTCSNAFVCMLLSLFLTFLSIQEFSTCIDPSVR